MSKAKFGLVLALLLGLALCCSGTPADTAKVVTLTSLEWPPYTGDLLPEQGASSAVARAAFAAMGYRLNIEFYPWSRAVSLAQNRAAYAGYMPEYYSSEVAERFILSDPIGTSPLALAQRRDAPVHWNAIADLAPWTVGVVQGYVNNGEFDRRVAERRQRVDVAISDELNLKKLAARHIDLAIVDSYVFGYLAGQDPILKQQLEINPKVIEDKRLYVAFKRSADGLRWASIFNQGLKKIDVAAIMRKFVKDYRQAA